MTAETEVEKTKEESQLPELAGEKESELEEMFKAGVHFAYSRSRRHPKMAPFIYGIKNNVEVFDLEKVRECFAKAEEFLKKLGQENKNVLWVGTKPSLGKIVEKIGKESGAFYVARRWIGGTLTNVSVISARLKYFEDLKNKKQSGEINKYTKKEQLQITRELSSLEERFSGIENFRNNVDALVVVDPKEEKTALSEARRAKLPLVGIMSSDNDPGQADYPIPANDNSPSSVEYVLRRLLNAYLEGKRTPVSKNTENNQDDLKGSDQKTS